MQRDTLTRWMEGITQYTWSLALRTLFEPVYDRMSSVGVTISTPVISGAGSPTAKMGAADSYFVVQGIIVKIAASTALPVLTGCNAGANQFNVACFFVDVAGTMTMLPGTPGLIGAVKFPQFPKGKALIAILLINNGASVFTGNTTNLDTATTVYIAPIEGFDPYCLVGSFLP